MVFMVCILKIEIVFVFERHITQSTVILMSNQHCPALFPKETEETVFIRFLDTREVNNLEKV